MATLLGCVVVSFSGLIIGYIVKTFVDNKPAFLINSEGVQFSSNLLSGGFILAWENIESIEEESVKTNWFSAQKFIKVFYLIDPNNVITSDADFNSTDNKPAKTLSANFLNMKHSEILKLLKDSLAQSKIDKDPSFS